MSKKQPTARDYRVARAFFEEYFEDEANGVETGKEVQATKALLERADGLKYHTQGDKVVLTFNLTQEESSAQTGLDEFLPKDEEPASE